MKFNWGWRIAIVYSVFAISTIGFVTFAMSQKVELVRSDYYEHSLEHDKTQAALKRGESVSSAMVIELTEQSLNVALPSTQPGAKGKLVLYRPNSSSMDKSFDLGLIGASIPVIDLLAGRYTVVIEWQYANEAYKLERNIEVGA